MVNKQRGDQVPHQRAGRCFSILERTEDKADMNEVWEWPKMMESKINYWLNMMLKHKLVRWKKAKTCQNHKTNTKRGSSHYLYRGVSQRSPTRTGRQKSILVTIPADYFSYVVLHHVVKIQRSRSLTRAFQIWFLSWPPMCWSLLGENTKTLHCSWWL